MLEWMTQPAHEPRVFDRAPPPQAAAGALRAIAFRVAADYARSDRGAEYAALLRQARDAGYEPMSLTAFHARSGTPPAGVRWLVLRHDVDIADVAGNEAFYRAERAAGARSTFYFRSGTAAPHAALIADLLRDGFEVGYHFEEGASVAKRLGLDSRAAVLDHRDEIADMFRRNCRAFRERWNGDLASVASHGDWINRRLGFTNNELVSPALLEACGLRFEAYGDAIMGRVDVYVSDVARAPNRWARGYGLDDAVRDGRHPVCLLTHERRWHRNRRAVAAADAGRTFEGLRYRVLRMGRR